MDGDVRVAVVGGGISGLSAAFRLRRRLGPNAFITVVESSQRLGGKLWTRELAGVPYDVGAEAFLARRPEVLGLVEDLGLTASLVRPTSAKPTIRAGGRTSPMPPRTFLGLPTSARAMAGVLSDEAVARVAAEPALPPPLLDGADLAVGALARQRFGAEVVERLIDPLLGGVYAGRADDLSLRATMPAVAAALDAGSPSLLAAAASVLPGHDKAADPPDPVFGGLRGGLSCLVDRLASASGAHRRLGLPVRALHRCPAGWRLEIGSAPNPEVMDVDAVILAVPAPAARRLLDGLVPVAAGAFAQIPVASMAVVGLALPADVAPMLPQASGVLIAAGERHRDGTPFVTKAFTYSSRKWAHLDGPDHLLVRGSVGRFGDIEALRYDDAELVMAVRSDLAELTGIDVPPIDWLVSRWGGGLPQYGVGHLDLVDRIQRAERQLPGMAIAGAALHGVGLPACVATATAAADRIVTALTD